MRTAALLQFLRRRYVVDAVFFAQTGDPDPLEAIPPGVIATARTVRLPAHGRGLAHRAARNALRWLRGIPPLNDRFGRFATEIQAFLDGRRWDLAVIEHSWCAPYAPLLRAYAATLILNLHNVESELHRRCAVTEPGATRYFHRRFAQRARSLEAQLLPDFDLVLATSEEDRALACGIAPAARFAIYPNTVPLREVHATARRQIVFSGNLEYHPNRTGVAWFARHVWPRIRDRHRDIEWVLVGKNPDSVRPFVQGPRVRLTGEVEDALPEIASSIAAIAPLRSGSGTRIKILEAWSAGVPVVSTAVGAEGLPAEGVLLAEDPDGFANAVTRLVESERLRAQIASRASEIFNRDFTWEAGWAVLDDLGL
ncbi:MAG: glycosyltransferase [Bryobacteraceae bacterium]